MAASSSSQRPKLSLQRPPPFKGAFLVCLGTLLEGVTTLSAARVQNPMHAGGHEMLGAARYKKFGAVVLPGLRSF